MDLLAAVAQAEVFNNHSWDLWTQMWHTQLRPVDELDGWLTLLEDTSGDLSWLPFLNPQEVNELADYLESVEPLADDMAMH